MKVKVVLCISSMVIDSRLVSRLKGFNRVKKLLVYLICMVLLQWKGIFSSRLLKVMLQIRGGMKLLMNRFQFQVLCQCGLVILLWQLKFIGWKNSENSKIIRVMQKFENVVVYISGQVVKVVLLVVMNQVWFFFQVGLMELIRMWCLVLFLLVKGSIMFILKLKLLVSVKLMMSMLMKVYQISLSVL